MSELYRYDIKDLQKLFRKANKQIDSLKDKPSDLLLFKLSEDTWNIHEICQHLSEFGRLYLEQMNRAITKATPMPQKKGPFQPRWFYRKIAGFLEPPYKMKLKTLPMMTPEPDEETTSAFDDLADIQANVEYLLENAKDESWNLEKIKGHNPASRLLRMNLIEFLVILEVHQRRHFWQIEQIMKKFGDDSL